MAPASEKATAAVQILKGDAVEPTSRSEPATTTTTASANVAAVQSFFALPSAVRRGRPPGSTNRPVQATASRTTTQDQPGQPKGPGHKQFPLKTWSLTVSRVSIRRTMMFLRSFWPILKCSSTITALTFEVFII